MNRYTRIAAVVMAALMLTLGAGCSKKKKAKKATAAGPGPAGTVQEVKAPKELLAYVGMRSPGKTIDKGLALLQKFAALPFTREAMLDMLAQQARLPSSLMGAVDVEGTFWMLALDPKQVGDSDPSVLVLPLKDRKKFEAALTKRMKKGKVEGDVVTYEPKEGQVGLQKIAMVITDKHALFPSSLKALDKSRQFIELELQNRKPERDLEVHVLMDAITKAQGDALDREIKRTMAEMKATMAKQNKGPIDQKPMADATEKAIERWAGYLKSTKKLVISLDVTADQLTLSVSGEGIPNGELHKVIKRQMSGQPAGLERLPASSWLVISDHGNPGAAKENASTWGPAMDAIFKEADPKVKAKMAALVTRLAAMNDGPFTTALHRAPSGKGLALTVIGKIKKPKEAAEAVDSLLKTLGEWVKAEAKKQGEKLPEGLEVKREEIKKGGAIGALLSLSIPFPADKANEKELTESLVGLPVTVGWAFTEKELFIVAGKETKAQLDALIAGKTGSKALAGKPDFRASLKDAGNQVGMVYLSLVDLLRWFKGTKVEEMMPPPLRGDLKDPPTSPVLTWGVNQPRTKMDVTLRLPAAHFLTFKPMLDAAMKSGGLPAEALFGPGNKGL